MKHASTPPNTFVISYLTLRKAIGWLGLLLPFVLIFGNALANALYDYEYGCSIFKSSVSHYYYTRMGEVFVGTIFAFALFLFCYKGPEKIDSRLSNIAGLFALGIALFPTSSEEAITCNLRNYTSSETIGNIHFACAALFFLTLAHMSFWIFTKSGPIKTPQKIKRNFIYRTCALVMVGTLAIIAVYVLWIRDANASLENYYPIFWLEAIALVAFGFSWLIKGEFMLKDE